MAGITLHEALRIVLHDIPDRTASTEHISRKIIKRKLYAQQKHGNIFPEQIFLRARQHPQLFDLDGRTVVTVK